MSSGIHVYKKDQYTYDGHSTFVDESLRQNERGIGNDIDIDGSGTVLRGLEE